MPLCCRYYSVAYFVCAQSPGGRGWEPLMEVDDQSAGEELISWLSAFPLGIHQFLSVANDNVMI